MHMSVHASSQWFVYRAVNFYYVLLWKANTDATSPLAYAADTLSQGNSEATSPLAGAKGTPTFEVAKGSPFQAESEGAPLLADAEGNPPLAAGRDGQVTFKK
jgi:hypothetical protein